MNPHFTFETNVVQFLVEFLVQIFLWLQKFDHKYIDLTNIILAYNYCYQTAFVRSNFYRFKNYWFILTKN